MEQRLLTFEKDLVHTLEVVNKQFKLSTAISQQKKNIQKFIDDLVDGLVNDGKITFWAHDQEVNLFCKEQLLFVNIYIKYFIIKLHFNGLVFSC